MFSPDLELATEEVERISEALGISHRSTEYRYMTTFYGAPPRTVVEDAVRDASFNSILPSDGFPIEEYVSGVGGVFPSYRNDLSLAAVNQDQQPPSPQQVKDKIKWGNNVIRFSAHQQVMDPYDNWSTVLRLCTVEGLKDGDTITSIPSDGLLLECYPSDACWNGVNAIIKDEFS